ncbi:MAB_1171c family putative transporter [Nonomuraea recticatena]|uniref:DUF6545 domain-containing protein n=1 Tax=Nonomuraea recticatena TaxID=46178 RepID=A0ABP6FJ89_9ACTN
MTLVDWIALILLWGAAISRIRPAMTSYSQRMLWAAFTALALSRVFTAAPIVAWLDATTGMEVATLARHITGLASATCLLAYVEVITRRDLPSRARWIWPTALIVISVLTTMFILRGGRIYWVDGAHAPAGGTSTAGRAYLAVFDGWLIICLAAAGVMFARFLRVAPPLLRVGLALSTMGMAAGVINRGQVMVVNVAHLINPDTTWREWSVLGRTTFLLCIVGITAGTSIPAYRALKARMRLARDLSELRPLWQALVDQYPGISLGMKGTLGARRVRRVLEIRDGMLSLTSVEAPPATEEPREVAAWVAEALAVARAGRAPGVPSGKIPGPDFAGDVEKETVWLRAVAAQFKLERAAQRVR